MFGCYNVYPSLPPKKANNERKLSPDTIIFIAFQGFMVKPKARALRSSPRLGIVPINVFCMFQKKTTSLILRRKLGGPLQGRGMDQPFNGRYSLTDHKKNLMFPNLSTLGLLGTKVSTLICG